MTNKSIFFKTNNIYAQDGSVDEYEIGKTCELHIQGRVINEFQEVSLDTTTIVSPLEEMSVPTTPELSYIHLKDSQYDIVGCIYRKQGKYTFMDIGDFCIFLCKDAEDLEEGKFYNATVNFVYDIWDCYNLEMHDTHEEDLELEGTTQSIFVDTSRYIQSENKKSWTKENVDSKYDVSLDKTACWDDEEYSNGSVDYLIEISIKVEEEEVWTQIDMDDPLLNEDDDWQELMSILNQKIENQRVKADSGNIAAIFNLGALAYNSRDYETAFRYWKEAITIDFHEFVLLLKGSYLDGYCKGFLHVLASFKDIGISLETAIPLCNDYDNKVALAYYLTQRYQTENWKITDEKEGADYLFISTVCHSKIEELYFTTTKFFDKSIDAPNNWDLHTI